MAKSIAQSVVFNATPSEIFNMLMNSRKHAKFTGAPARLSVKPGASFTAHGSYITGRNIEIVPDERIVQAWRGSDWADGVYSVVTFALTAAPGKKAKLTFTQHGVPDEHVKSIRNGWREHYWEPMKVMLKESSQSS